MKNWFLLITFSLLLAANSFAQDGIRFEQHSWKELLSKAKKEDKLIFVDAYASWCGPCKQMARDVFTQKEVGEFFNTSFVNAKIDMEKGEGIGLSRDFGVMAYPTLLFVDHSGKVVHRAVGYHTSDLLLELGEVALDPDRNMGGTMEKYDNGDRSPELLRNLAFTKFDAMDGTYSEIAEEYLETQRDWSTTENMEFIYRMVSDVDSKMFEHMFENRSAYEEHLGQRAIEGKINELVQNEVSNAENEDDLEGVVALYKKIYPERGNEMAGRIKMAYYAQKEDWAGFAKATNDHYKKYPAESWDELNEYAWILYEEAGDKKVLKCALNWAKKSVKMESNYYNNDTMAALYYRLGKKGKAMKSAKKAIALAEQSGEDHSGTDELLEAIRKM